MIPGLRYVPGYLDGAAHDALLAAVDAVPWRDFGERRAQIYGYSFDDRLMPDRGLEHGASR